VRRQRKITRLEQLAAAEAEERKRKEEIERAEKEKEERKRREEAAPSFIEMVPVEGGAFQFCDKYEVTVSDFMIGKYPVTQKQWREIMGNNPSHFKGDDLPVESVSWEDVKAFIKKLNERFPGRYFRLPSETEWEYAARGGRLSEGYAYAGSNNLEEVGWYSDNSGETTHPVGLKKANELGIHDMSGNVWEWCEDDWHRNIADIPPNGAPYIDQPKRDIHRMRRGGGHSNLARHCRVLYWGDHSTPYYRGGSLGFRLVSSPAGGVERQQNDKRQEIHQSSPTCHPEPRRGE
jgi:formylglycine-generating enzyme required for sulfatase activity